MNGSLASLRSGHVLLVNPPIADTIEAEQQDMITSVLPFGLLRIASLLRSKGCKVTFLDCLRDPALQGRLRRHVRKHLPCGNWEEERITKAIHHFGLDRDLLRERLRTLPPPDLVGIGSIFTWHGEAVREVIEVCREVFPSARIVLGGNFATLCPEEAAALGPDEVFVGDLEEAIWEPTAIDLAGTDRSTDFLRLVKGCPNRCSYCVTRVLNGGRVRTRDHREVLEEMKEKIRRHGTRTFIFYDDYVLYRHASFLDPLLDEIAASGLDVELEFALGFAAHQITESLVDRLVRAGVRRMVLALETIRLEESRQMNRPHHLDEFIRAVRLLRSKGFRGRNLRSFYIIGLPGQVTDEILRAILFLYSLEVMPSLTTYALTPRSADMKRYRPLVQGLSLDELAPCLWRFAHPGMKVRELDAIYRFFHERWYPLDRIRLSRTDEPIIRAMQDILARQRHLPERW